MSSKVIIRMSSSSYWCVCEEAQAWVSGLYWWKCQAGREWEEDEAKTFVFFVIQRCVKTPMYCQPIDSSGNRRADESIFQKENWKNWSHNQLTRSTDGKNWNIACCNMLQQQLSSFTLQLCQCRSDPTISSGCLFSKHFQNRGPCRLDRPANQNNLRICGAAWLRQWQHLLPTAS